MTSLATLQTLSHEDLHNRLIRVNQELKQIPPPERDAFGGHKRADSEEWDRAERRITLIMERNDIRSILDGEGVDTGRSLGIRSRDFGFFTPLSSRGKHKELDWRDNS